MAPLVIAAFAVLVLFGLSRWSHIVRARLSAAEAAMDGSGDQWLGQAGRSTPADVEPDLPMPFGRGLAWLAISTTDLAAVVRGLGLRTAVPANWRAGLAAAGSGLFCTPPVAGFVCAIGRDAWQRGDLDAIGAALVRLSSAHGAAFWFGLDEASECFGWALARGGRLERRFCYAGEGPTILCDEGAVTTAEADLGFFVEDPRDQTDDPIKWWPTAADVLRLAAHWSVDPQRPPGAAPGIGWLGRW